jgi:hypothetical protein
MDINTLLVTPKTPRITEIPDSQDIPTRSSRATTQSWDSRAGPRPVNSESPEPYFERLQTPQTPTETRRHYAPTTTRTDRIRIKTALELGHSWSDIQNKLGYTRRQIQLARRARVTPLKRGTRTKISTPKRHELKQWLLASPSHRRIAYRHILSIAPYLDLHCKERAIRTAFKLVRYGRRVAKRKGFSDDPKVIDERLQFALEAKEWPEKRLY